MDQKTIENLLSRTTLRQVDMLVALQIHGSMTGTAKALGMSVASVSRMTARFEKNVGFRIFAGENRRFVLNDQAHRIIELLEPLAKTISSLRTDLARIDTAPKF